MGSTLPPTDDRVRWSVIPLRNCTGAYWYVSILCVVRLLSSTSDNPLSSRIAPVADKTLSLNVTSGKREDWTKVQLCRGSSNNTDFNSM
jgi:hypothetical protein